MSGLRTCGKPDISEFSNRQDFPASLTRMAKAIVSPTSLHAVSRPVSSGGIVSSCQAECPYARFGDCEHKLAM